MITEPAANVTIIERCDGAPAGKTISVDGKRVAAHTGRYTAKTITLKGGASEILEGYRDLVEKLQINQAVILGHATSIDGSEYQIRPRRELPGDGTGVHVIDGQPYLARLKQNFSPSRILLLDFDPADDMPSEWKRLGEQDRWDMLCEVFPEWRGAARLTIPSSSGRVLGPDGAPYKKGPTGSHTYIVLDREVTSDELDAMRVSLEVRLWAGGLGFMTSRTGARLRRTLIDTSVWSSCREVFDGPPCVIPPLALAPLTSTVIGRGFARPIAPATLEETRSFEALTGSRVRATRAPARRQNGVVGPKRPKTIQRLVIDDFEALRMSTPIETEIGVMTLVQFLDSGFDKLRCQTPFRQSTSWAGILRRVNENAFLHDVGTNTTYWLFDHTIKIDKDIENSLKSVTDQGKARAFVRKYFGRAPASLSLSDLVALASKNGADAKDLEAFVTWLSQKRKRTPKVASSDATLRQMPSMGAIEETMAKDTPVGVHLVKAPHGSGKTQGLLRPIALRSPSVLAIAPRVSLVSDLCQRLRLDNYQVTSRSPRLGICLNSISNPKYEAITRNRVVLVDEISRCLKECHTKSTLKSKGQKTFNRLVELLKNAELAIGVDADLSDRDIEALVSAGVEVTVWVVDEKPREQTAYFDRAVNVIEEFKCAIEKGEKCLFISDSAKRVAELASWIKSCFQDKRVVEIHAKKGCATTGRADVKELLKDINKIDGIDVLLMSPAVESGLSLNVKHFDRHFAIYSGVIEPTEFNQMLMRDRTARLWAIGIEGEGYRDLPTDYETALNNLDATQRETISWISEHIGWGIDDEGFFDDAVVMTPRTLYDERCIRWAIDSNINRSNYASNLYYLLEDRGWTVESRWKDGSSDGRDIIRQASEMHKKEYTHKIVTARDLYASDAERLREQHIVTPEQSAAVAKYEVKTSTGVTDVTPEAVEQWAGGRLVGQRVIFDGARVRGVSLTDIAEAKNKVPLAMRRHETARNAAVALLLERLGIDIIHGKSKDITKETALEAYNSMRDTPEAAVLEHTGIADFTYILTPAQVIQWVQRVLARMGLWLESRSVGHARRGGRVYRLALGEKRTKDGRFLLPGWKLMHQFYLATNKIPPMVTPPSLDHIKPLAVTNALSGAGTVPAPSCSPAPSVEPAPPVVTSSSMVTPSSLDHIKPHAVTNALSSAVTHALSGAGRVPAPPVVTASSMVTPSSLDHIKPHAVTIALSDPVSGAGCASGKRPA